MRLAALLAVAMVVSPALAVGQARTDWAGLAAQYRQALLRSPTDLSTRYSLAMVYAHEGRVLDGWRELQALSKQLDSSQRQAFAAQVIAGATQVLQRTPGDILTRYRLAFALYFTGHKDVARQQFEQIVAFEPTHPWSLGYLGYTYMERGDLDRAIVLWERGVAVDPGNSVLHYVLGLAYTRKGALKKAAGHFAAAYRDRTLYEYVQGKGGK